MLDLLTLFTAHTDYHIWQTNAICTQQGSCGKCADSWQVSCRRGKQFRPFRDIVSTAVRELPQPLGLWLEWCRKHALLYSRGWVGYRNTAAVLPNRINGLVCKYPGSQLLRPFKHLDSHHSKNRCPTKSLSLLNRLLPVKSLNSGRLTGLIKNDKQEALWAEIEQSLRVTKWTCSQTLIWNFETSYLLNWRCLRAYIYTTI